MNRRQRRAGGHPAKSRKNATGDPPLPDRDLDAAIAHNRAGRLTEARRLCDTVLSRTPGNADALHLSGVLFLKAGQRENAIGAFRGAIDIRPGFVEALFNLGLALLADGNTDSAAETYRTLIDAAPDLAGAHAGLGKTLVASGALVDAVAAFRRATELDAGLAVAHNDMGNTLLALGRADEAIRAYRSALDARPDDARVHSNILLCLNYIPHISQDEIYGESVEWARSHAPSPATPPAPPGDPDPDRRLRIGYVSPDFREHPVACFLEAAIRRPDREAFEIFCYADVQTPDAKTRLFEKFSDGWRSIAGQPHEAVQHMVRTDKIDILVDVAGHTFGNRLPVFASRPAPVQVTWLGYPNTTGMDAMDYRLAGVVSDPPGPDDALHSETLVRLPDGFLCFAPPDGTPDPEHMPAQTRDHVTFGSFNNFAKIGPGVLGTWARILESVPRSRLLIKVPQRADDRTRAAYGERLSEFGIDAARVVLSPWVASKTDHLALYRQIDICLDPFPYNGTTTTCEALWMGVPVVTLRGDRHAGRVGAEILTGIGLDELIADTPDDYVETAVTLARSSPRLADLRGSLRDRMRHSPICDTAGFTRRLEEAFRRMWQGDCAAE